LDPDNRNCLFGVLRLDISVVVNERIRYSLLFFVFWQIKFSYSAACGAEMQVSTYLLVRTFFSRKLEDGNHGRHEQLFGSQTKWAMTLSDVTKSSSKPKTFPCPVRRQTHLPRTKTHCLSGLLTDLIFVTTCSYSQAGLSAATTTPYPNGSQVIVLQ